MDREEAAWLFVEMLYSLYRLVIVDEWEALSGEEW
jgi:hypothetical protein